MMKRAIQIVILSVLTLCYASEIQLIHNAPSRPVNVDFNGSELVYELNYMSATAPISVPGSGTISVSSTNGSYSHDFVIDIESGKKYVGGILGSLENQNDPLKIAISPLIVESEIGDGFEIKFFNGISDIEGLDFYINEQLIFQNLTFGEFSGYLDIPTQTDELIVRESGTNFSIGTYNVDLSQRTGQTGIIFASGFYHNDQTSAPVALNIAYPNGSVGRLENIVSILDETASVQIIHNSPYPVVDIYVDGTEALGDVPYRATTGLIDLPISTTVGIAPANDAIIASFPFSLVSGGHYVVTASGIVGDTDHPFDLVASTLDTAAVDADHFALKVYHGVTDAPAVDIYANGSLLVDSLDYGDYAGYVQVPVGDYTIDVAAHGSTTPVASFSAPLTGLGGGAGVVFASGFLSPARTDSAFTLILTTPSGYSVELPATTTALATDDEIGISPLTFELNQNYPNPFNPTTTIGFQLSNPGNVVIKIFDINGRLVRAFNQTSLNSGSHSVIWNGTNQAGQYVAGGLYLYSLSSGDNSSAIRKMTLVK